MPSSQLLLQLPSLTKSSSSWLHSSDSLVLLSMCPSADAVGLSVRVMADCGLAVQPGSRTSESEGCRRVTAAVVAGCCCCVGFEQVLRQAAEVSRVVPTTRCTCTDYEVGAFAGQVGQQYMHQPSATPEPSSNTHRCCLQLQSVLMVLDSGSYKHETKRI